MKKVYTVEFKPMYPVGNCLVIVAENGRVARQIAKRTITHTTKFRVKEFKGDGVVVYLSGDY